MVSPLARSPLDRDVVASSLITGVGPAGSHRLLLPTSQFGGTVGWEPRDDVVFDGQNVNRHREVDDLFAELGAEPSSFRGQDLSPSTVNWSSTFANLLSNVGAAT